MDKNFSYNQAFREGDCLAFQLTDGQFAGIVICKVHNYRQVNKYFFLITNLLQNNLPQLSDFMNAVTYGREEKNYLDDVLLVLDKRLPAFFGKFQIVGNVPMDPDTFRIGSFRHQNSSAELEYSVRSIPKIQYLERKPYPIPSLLKK